MQTYMSYWGKAQPQDGAGRNWHPLAYHSLDVAAVTQAFLTANPAVLRALANAWNLSPQAALQFATYFAGVHDLGKLSAGFQSKAPEVFAELFPGEELHATELVHHSELGVVTLLDQWCQKWAARPLARRLLTALAPLANAAAGHHGKPELLTARPLAGVAAAAASAFLDDWAAILNIQEYLDQSWPLKEATPQVVAWCSSKPFVEVSLLLSGVISLCDWVGSNQELFPYQAPTLSLAEYWNIAKERAAAAICHCSLAQKTPAQLGGFDHLFGQAASVRAKERGEAIAPKTPTPLQQFADTVALPSDGLPGLYLLEDETGAGKTEAALTLASRLISAGNARGVFFCLPTQTTANAIYSRVLPISSELFDLDQRPTLTLAHGQARHAISRLRSAGGLSGITSDLTSWATDSAKTALLSDFGVGTIDQLAMAGLPVKHVTLRHAGLASKVLIIDEAHACDTYLLGLVQNALTLHAKYGGSAIILSATLPRRIKQTLVDAFAAGRKQTAPTLSANAYPLATSCAGGISGMDIAETPIAPRSTPRSLRFAVLTAQAENAQVAAWLAAGRSVCLMRNTVSRAQQSFKHYDSLYPGQVLLVHAKFVVQHRGENDARLLREFGLDSTPASRHGKIVIATQVAEQSLDVDFDEMVSDLAPFDALLQRAGRWRRHSRDAAGNRSPVECRPSSHLYVLTPRADGNEAFMKELPEGTRFVYPMAGVLFRTAQIVQGQGGFSGTLSIPHDVRKAVEYAYSEDLPVPAFLEDADMEAQGKALGAASTAQVRSLKIAAGYSVEAGPWVKVDSVTRLGEPSIRLVLSDVNGRPLFGDAVSSSIAIAVSALRGSALSSVTKGQTGCVVLFCLVGQGQWRCDLRQNTGKPLELHYSLKTGLSVQAHSS